MDELEESLRQWMNEFRSTPDWNGEGNPESIAQVSITRMRELLREQGVDPERCFVEWWPEGGCDEGWVVSSERRVYSFDLEGGKGDLRTSARTSFFSRWEDVTDSPDRWYPPEEVQAALRIIDGSQP